MLKQGTVTGAGAAVARRHILDTRLILVTVHVGSITRTTLGRKKAVPGYVAGLPMFVLPIEHSNGQEIQATTPVLHPPQHGLQCRRYRFASIGGALRRNRFHWRSLTTGSLPLAESYDGVGSMSCTYSGTARKRMESVGTCRGSMEALRLHKIV
jgi:hypothetical protein